MSFSCIFFHSSPTVFCDFLFLASVRKRGAIFILRQPDEGMESIDIRVLTKSSFKSNKKHWIRLKKDPTEVLLFSAISISYT